MGNGFELPHPFRGGGVFGKEDMVSSKYRHDRALAAIRRAEEQYAIEEWKKGKLVCEWCGQPLEPKAGFPDQVFVAEMARRMADDPQAWSALVYDCGQPGMKLEELAKLLKCSVPTASRARGRARELAKGMGMGSLCGHATPRLRGRRRDGGAKVLSEGVGRAG